MKIEAIGNEYHDLTLNIDNHEVVFKDNISEVSDDLGALMIKEFPHFFPEGQVKIAEKNPTSHVFDETKYQEQFDRIVSLQNSLKAEKQNVFELKAELKEWKAMHDELQERLSNISQKRTDWKKEEAPVVQEEEKLDTEEGYRNRLEEKGLEELKTIAKELHVLDEKVKKRTSKKSWIDAIIETTFSV